MRVFALIASLLGAIVGACVAIVHNNYERIAAQDGSKPTTLVDIDKASLLQRIENLERELLSIKKPGEQILRALKFDLVDWKGQQCGEWSTIGQPHLKLYTPGGGGSQASLEISPAGSQLALCDDKGFVRLSMQTGQDGTSIFLYDKGHTLTTVGDIPINALGPKRMSITLDSESPGTPHIALYDPGRVMEGNIGYFDGPVRAELGCTTLQSIKTGVVEEHPPSTLVLFNKDGKVLFKAPHD